MGAVVFDVVTDAARVQKMGRLEGVTQPHVTIAPGAVYACGMHTAPWEDLASRGGVEEVGLVGSFSVFGDSVLHLALELAEDCVAGMGQSGGDAGEELIPEV